MLIFPPDEKINVKNFISRNDTTDCLLMKPSGSVKNDDWWGHAPCMRHAAGLLR